MEQGFLYGLEPPAIDKVWEKIRKQKFAVITNKRHHKTGKEKKVDTKLAVDITAKLFETPIEKRSTIVVISGDADMIPAIEKALKCKGWLVEVYMWKDALSKEIKGLGDHVSVIPLGDYLDRIMFTNMKFNLRANIHLYTSNGTGIWSCFFSETKRIPTTATNSSTLWCAQLESIAQWPFQYYWLENDHIPTDDLVLVFRSSLNDKRPEMKFDHFIYRSRQ